MFEYFPNNYPWSLAVMGTLSRGGQISEIDEACRPLKEIAARKNDPIAQLAWYESWMKLAERVERLGAIDEQANHPLSAGRKYLRAGLYYLTAERMPSHKDPRRMIAYKRGIEVYAKGLKLRKEPVERVEVPYGEHKLPAFFMKAPVPGRAPCMVHFDGFDVMKEIIYGGTADEYRRRGISLLIVDHPGVGEALRLQHRASTLMPTGSAWWRSVSAAITHRARRPTRNASSAASPGARFLISASPSRRASAEPTSHRCRVLPITRNGCSARRRSKRRRRSRGR